MNFFAHAYLAERVRKDARFVLGSMLPDLQNMAGIRLEDVRCETMRQGCAHHHQVDSVFHPHPVFSAHYVTGVSDLRERGWPAGAARAFVHLALEWSIDLWLLEQSDARFAQPAIHFGQSAEFSETLSSDALLHLHRVTDLFQRLEPLSEKLRENSHPLIADMITRALEQRPRLRIPVQLRTGLADHVATLEQRLRPQIPQLLLDVEQSVLWLQAENANNPSLQ